MRAAATVVAIAGPNGAGKSTAAPFLLKETLGLLEFVNADLISQGLSGFDPERAAFRAGRVMLDRMKTLAETRASFAFETTLASRSFAPWIRGLTERGYEFHLIFLSLESAEVAVARVRERVRAGGHDVPEATVRRRYERGLANFFRLYRPLAKTWRLYDNSGDRPRLVAAGGTGEPSRVLDAPVWQRIASRHER